MPSFFAAAFAVAGAIAAVGPILIHLLNRFRYRVIEWAAMDFLREIVQRHRRMLQWRDLLLMTLRAACLLMFGLALARPYWSLSATAVDPHQPVHAVLVVDNSLSMAYAPAGEALFQEAKRKANTFIERLPPGSRISILPWCEMSSGLSRDAYHSRQEAQQALESMVLADRAAGAGEALDRAVAACRQVTDIPEKRVVFIGDQQISAWPAGIANAYRDNLPDLQVLQVAPARPENAWIARFILRDGIADLESPAQLLVTVRYEGSAPRLAVPVTLSVQGRVVASQTIDLEPGQARELSFTTTFEVLAEPGKPYFATARVFLPPDHLTLDDERTLVAPVVAALPVLFVDQWGTRESPERNRHGETWDLRRLLAPVLNRVSRERPLLEIRRATLDEVDAATLADVRLVVVAGVERPDPRAVQTLREYVLQGGRLLLAAGAQFDPRAWNDLAWREGAGILPAPLKPDVVGKAIEQADGELKPFQLSFDGVVHDYFLIEQEPRESLADLYRLPFFFKAVVADLDEATLASLQTRETERISARQQQLEDLRAELARLRERERAGTLEATDLLRRDQCERQIQALQPRWLTWARAEPEIASTPDQQARRARPRLLASFSQGLPFLIERDMGQGQVVFLATGLRPSWNTLCKTNAVLLLDRIVRQLLERTLPRRNSEDLAQQLLPVSDDERRLRFTLERPGGQTEPLNVEAFGGEVYGLTIAGLQQRGVYRVSAWQNKNVAVDTQGQADMHTDKVWETVFAANGPEAESDLAVLDESTWRQRVENPHYRWLNQQEEIQLEGARIQGQYTWKWFLALVLLGLLVEMFLVASRTPLPVPTTV